MDGLMRRGRSGRRAERAYGNPTGRLWRVMVGALFAWSLGVPVLLWFWDVLGSLARVERLLMDSLSAAGMVLVPAMLVAAVWLAPAADRMRALAWLSSLAVLAAVFLVVGLLSGLAFHVHLFVSFAFMGGGWLVFVPPVAFVYALRGPPGPLRAAVFALTGAFGALALAILLFSAAFSGL
jgi:hypothetical protein